MDFFFYLYKDFHWWMEHALFTFTSKQFVAYLFARENYKVGDPTYANVQPSQMRKHNDASRGNTVHVHIMSK